MGNLYQYQDYRRPARGAQHGVFFTRGELNLLLSLYSRRVMSGDWRDYAIDRQVDMAVFSVFRHTLDQPLFTIAKRRRGGGCEYLVLSGRQKVAQAEGLAEALTVFGQKLKVVS